MTNEGHAFHIALQGHCYRFLSGLKLVEDQINRLQTGKGHQYLQTMMML